MKKIPRCFERSCKHYLGIKTDGNKESTERPICNAFPNEIPEDIAYGKNLHLNSVDGDSGIQYEKEPNE